MEVGGGDLAAMHIVQTGSTFVLIFTLQLLYDSSSQLNGDLLFVNHGFKMVSQNVNLASESHQVHLYI